MKKPTILLCVLAILLGLTAIASARRPPLGPFTTTGYTTLYEPLKPEPPYLLPSGHIKFHLTARGGGEDGLYDGICGALAYYNYSLPVTTTCASLCPAVTGQPCGASGYFDGEFAFEEWAIVDLSTGQGVNHGIMTVTTDDGEAVIRFGGRADFQNVWGNFTVLRGTDEYKGLKGQGTHAGNAGLVFSVEYEPCKKCVKCAAIGGDLKLKRKEAKWKLTNNGKDKITISSITINWPDDNGQLKKVKLGKKTIYDQTLCSTSVRFPSSCWATINSGWEGKDKDRQIGKGKTRELKFEFKGNVSTDVSDYTILVEFAEGCAATAVAFPPAS